MKAILVEEEPEEEMKEIDLGMALQRMDSPEFPSPAEKPLVSSRFHHRKPFKPNPEGNYHISFLTFFVVLRGGACGGDDEFVLQGEGC